MFKQLRHVLRGGCGEEGVAAVEFGILLPLLVLLILGGMDLAHMYYINYVITNASREGARYATKYTVKADGTPNPPPTSDQISTYVKSTLNYNSYNFPNFGVNAVTSGTPTVVTVSVQADKHWWILGTFNFYGMLGLTDPMTLTGTTAMATESP
jgi:Flp pilus assembly protein TadG